MPPRILIAGIGNIFFGDDSFGVEIAQRMANRSLPDGVLVVDFGIRGYDLTFALLEDIDAVILVDAVPRGGTPGTLYVIEPDVGDTIAPEPSELLIDPHALDPTKVLRAVKALGGRINRLLLVGCEPTPIDDTDDIAPGLSEPVRAALDEAISMIESLVREIRETFLTDPETIDVRQEGRTHDRFRSSNVPVPNLSCIPETLVGHTESGGSDAKEIG